MVFQRVTHINPSCPTQVSIQAGRIISRLAESEAGLLRLLRHAEKKPGTHGAFGCFFQQNMLGLSGVHML